MSILEINGKQSAKVVAIPHEILQPNGFFDRVEDLEKKRPESDNPGIYKHRNSSAEFDRLAIDNPSLPEPTNFYKKSSGSVSERYIKFLPGQSADWLQENHPNAFLLLCLIARRARRYNGHPDGLSIGMAHIGDFKQAGIESERKYRTAKDVLIRIGAVKIVETARKRKKSTTESTIKTTTTGTLVLLLKSDIWDINPKSTDDRNDDRNDDRPTTDRRPTDDEQEELSYISSTSRTTSLSSSQAQKTKVKEKIFFNWETKKLEGITEEEIASWKETFPNIDVVEYLKFIEQDIGMKPTKYKNRKRIVQTVFIYLKNRNENQAAFQARQKNGAFPQKPQKESLHNKSFNKDTRPAPTHMRLDFSQEFPK